MGIDLTFQSFGLLVDGFDLVDELDLFRVGDGRGVGGDVTDEADPTTAHLHHH